MQPIKRDELNRLMSSGEDFALIEALPKSEYDHGHIPGALSMPLETLAAEAPKQLADKSRKIVTYCASADCAASTKAAEILEGLGYTNVSDYVGGKQDWKSAGLRLEGSEVYDENIQGDGLDEGHGEASAVSSRTVEDLESLARDYQKEYRTSSAGGNDTYFNTDHQSGREI
ncbi:MAG: rhodanese-like domain-containing protein [Alphaproteobacteria bacterium]|nr:rhodanese-like domain-containing protein [Alphaproteobacteria bacterium]